MNVALLIESLEGGGAERVIQRLALGLARRAVRPFVYCLRSAGAAGCDLQAAGILVREAGSIGRDVLLTWRLGTWLHRDRIDVAHAHSCAALARVFPAAQLLQIPLLHVWHGWPSETPTRYHRLATRLDPFVARIGINSESLRSKLPTGRPARSAAHLPNGIDLLPAAPLEARRRLEALCGRAFDGPVVLNVANIRVEKDTCGLLAGFARLRQARPDAHLVCVGAVRSDEYWREVQRTLTRLGLNGHAHFPGEFCEAWQLMAGADVFCLGSRAESMPNVILEAMSQRVPIVSTAVGDVGRMGAVGSDGPWILRDNETGLLVPPGDWAALALALARVLRDPAAARARADRAFEDYRRRFTTDQMVSRYLRVYQELHAGGRGGRTRATTRRRRAVLMLGPGPPQTGGMVTSINVLMRSPLRERYALQRCATLAPRGTLGSHGGRPVGLVRAGLRHAAALAELAATLIRARVDLLHVHTCSYVTFYRSLLDVAVGRLLGRAVVLHIRGGRFERFCETAGRARRWVIRRGLRAASAVLVVSPRWRDLLRRHAGRTPVYVVPNAVEPLTLGATASSNGRPCRFLYLANLTTAKGVGDLIDAAARLRSDPAAPPFELLIAGPTLDEPQAVWEARTRNAGLAAVTRFLGPVRGAAKYALLQSADCFVHPSHSEAFPNAVLEAAAAGLPVVATAVGSLPEAMAADGEQAPLCPLVPPRDAGALAQAMKRMASDAALRRQVGARLRRHVTTHFHPALVAARVARVYECVLDGRRRPLRAASAAEPEVCPL